MLLYLYLGALIFGGVLLGSSILLGGHDDADGDLDADGELDADGDLDKELAHDGFGGSDFLFWLRSLRFYTFFATFFGLTGVTLHVLGLVQSPWIGLALAIGMGLFTGIGASAAIRRLMADGSLPTTNDVSYIGKSAKVLVPVKKDGVGKVRVRVGGSHVDVLAVTDDEELASEDEAIVIEMEGTRARIARIDD